MKATIGRIVNYVTLNGFIRPAIVVQALIEGKVNLHVFEDGPDDVALEGETKGLAKQGGWVGQVDYVSRTADQGDRDYVPRSWHWPIKEKEKEVEEKDLKPQHHKK